MNSSLFKPPIIAIGYKVPSSGRQAPQMLLAPTSNHHLCSLFYVLDRATGPKHEPLGHEAMGAYHALAKDIDPYATPEHYYPDITNALIKLIVHAHTKAKAWRSRQPYLELDVPYLKLFAPRFNLAVEMRLDMQDTSSTVLLAELTPIDTLLKFTFKTDKQSLSYTSWGFTLDAPQPEVALSSIEQKLKEISDYSAELKDRHEQSCQTFEHVFKYLEQSATESSPAQGRFIGYFYDERSKDKEQTQPYLAYIGEQKDQNTNELTILISSS